MDWHTTLYNWLWPDCSSRILSTPKYEAPIHGLRGLLHTLGQKSLGNAADEHAYNRNIAHHLRVQEILTLHWPREQGPPFVMKGFDYALNLYPKIGLRHSNDIDILIDPMRFQSVAKILSERMSQRTEPTENRLRTEAPSAHTFELDGIVIDLHQHPVMNHQTRLETVVLLERSETGRLGNLSVLFPSNEDRLWLWLHNFGKNFHPIAAHHLLDLVLILKTLFVTPGEVNWSELSNKAKLLGLSSTLQLALAYLEHSGLWSTPIPRQYRAVLLFQLDEMLRKSKFARFTPPLKAASLLHRTIPEGRLAVTKRLIGKLFNSGRS